jgi:hypothetical protein
VLRELRAESKLKVFLTRYVFYLFPHMAVFVAIRIDGFGSIGGRIRSTR